MLTPFRWTPHLQTLAKATAAVDSDEDEDAESGDEVCVDDPVIDIALRMEKIFAAKRFFLGLKLASQLSW